MIIHRGSNCFFRTNVYIVGFGMALSEIDIWWLLNKRALFLANVSGINNSIVYLYNDEYENEKMFRMFLPLYVPFMYLIIRLNVIETISIIFLRACAEHKRKSHCAHSFCDCIVYGVANDFVFQDLTLSA